MYTILGFEHPILNRIIINLFFNYQGVDKLREGERSFIRNTRDLVFAFDVFGT